MKFIEIHLNGFGKLVGRSFSFAPGLNLIFGANEAGKSTLQQALLSFLYGLFDEGQVTRARLEAATALIPWIPACELGGWLEYQLDDGRRFRAISTFSGKPVTRLEALPGGEDVSAEYRSASYERLFFAEQHLGLAKRVFENVCMVRQADLVALESSATAITDTLLRLSASASTETSSADALAQLDKALRDQVGTDRAWTKPLGSVRARRDSLEAERQRTIDVCREAWGLIRELRGEESVLTDLDEKIERLNCLEALAERQTLRHQLEASVQADEEAQKLAEEVERCKPWADFPGHLRDQVIRLDGERVRLEERLRELAPRMAQLRRKRTELFSQLAGAEARVHSLEDASDVEADRLPEVRRLAARWEAARRTEESEQVHLLQLQERLAVLEQMRAEQQVALGPLADAGSAGLAQLEERWRTAVQRAEHARTALQYAESEWKKVGLTAEQYGAMADLVHRFQAGTFVEERSRRGCRFWGEVKGPPGPPPEIGIFAQVQPLHDRFESARIEAQASQEALAAVETVARHQFGLTTDENMDPACFDSMRRRLAEYSRVAVDAYAQREGEGVARERLLDARRESEQAQLELAKALSFSDAGRPQLLAAVQSFEAACGRRAELDLAVVSSQQLRSADLLLAQEEEAQTQREAALNRNSETPCATLKQAQIEAATNDLEKAVRLYEEGYRQHQQWRLASDRHQAALARPATGLTQDDRDRARKRIGDLATQIEAWQRRGEDWSALKPEREAHEYRTRSQKLENDRLLRRERCSQLRDSLQQVQGDLRHPAELVEEIAETQERMRRLERLWDVLTLARSELEAATQEFQRAFAPRLERVMADGLASATQGRYTRALVDSSSLSVSVVAPGRGEPVSAGQLSTGTRELLYLLLRIGIGRLMSLTGENLPLMLDDPLVQLDHNRQQHALQLLAGLAEETQTLLFTKDNDILKWYHDKLTGDRKHRLHTLEP
jgi:DNA repair exonuclease SbcCD ATPase subunit